MGFGAVKILDINGLSYLYTKLHNNIDEFQSTSKSVIDSAAAAANTAADRANAVVGNANDTYATKDELKASIDKITSFEFSIVTVLPSEGVKGTIYLMENTGNQTSDENVYDEYIWVGSKYEKIGTTDINFNKYITGDQITADYLKKTDAATTYATKGEVTTVSDKADANAKNITANATNLTNHKADAVAHITKEERTAWNSKAAGNHKHTAADVGALATSTRGAKNGVASLDANGLVPSSQLPSYVDDVIEGYLSGGKFYKESAHTNVITGETGKIYVDLTTKKIYRWSGSAYAVISETLALGETSSTAYAGDKGKTLASNLSTHTSDTTVHITAAERTAWNGKAAGNHTHKYAGSSSAGGAATSALACTGNSATATKLATARNIAISGAVSGNANFDGSSNITINTKVQYGTAAPSSLADGVLYCVIE
mgnify:CR=1 FL=1